MGVGGYKKKKRERRRGRKGEKYCQFSTVAGRESAKHHIESVCRKEREAERERQRDGKR